MRELLGRCAELGSRALDELRRPGQVVLDLACEAVEDAVRNPADVRRRVAGRLDDSGVDEKVLSGAVLAGRTESEPPAAARPGDLRGLVDCRLERQTDGRDRP